MSSKSFFNEDENQNLTESMTDDPSSNLSYQGDGNPAILAESSDRAKVSLTNFSPLEVSHNSVSFSMGNDINMFLRVRQQPERSRMIGFAEKDRRPIDPPPVLELICQNKTGETIE